MHGTCNSEKWPDIRRKYRDKILIDSDSPSGFSVLYSCTDEFTARDVAAEFGLVGAEDYLNNCRRLRENVLKKTPPQ